MIDNGTTATAYFCADPNSAAPYDEHTAFEIGSVTKTMTAALLAEFIARGEIALNDPIAKLLPPGTPCRRSTAARSPSATSSPILGPASVPPRIAPTDINNPYAA